MRGEDSERERRLMEGGVCGLEKGQRRQEEEGGLELGPGCSPGTRQWLPVSEAHMMVLGAWAKVGKLGVLRGIGQLALSGAYVPCPVCVRGSLRQGVGPSQARFGAPWSHLERWGGGQSRARGPEARGLGQPSVSALLSLW